MTSNGYKRIWPLVLGSFIFTTFAFGYTYNVESNTPGKDDIERIEEAIITIREEQRENQQEQRIIDRRIIDKLDAIRDHQ